MDTLRDRHRSLDRFFSEPAFKALVMMNFTMVLNILFAVMKLCAGVYYHSLWLVTLAVYYGFLVLMMLMLLRNSRADEVGGDFLREFRKYRSCAVLLLLMNIVLVGIVVLVVRQNEGFYYRGLLIYPMAVYDFFIMANAIVKLVRVRRHGSPLLSAWRVVCLASALIAILSLETAMLAKFGDGDTAFRNNMVTLSGGGASLIIISAAAYMLACSGREIKKLEKENKL